MAIVSKRIVGLKREGSPEPAFSRIEIAIEAQLHPSLRDHRFGKIGVGFECPSGGGPSPREGIAGRHNRLQRRNDEGVREADVSKAVAGIGGNGPSGKGDALFHGFGRAHFQAVPRLQAKLVREFAGRVLEAALGNIRDKTVRVSSHRPDEMWAP